MKKILGVIVGMGLLGFVAHMAFAELTNTFNGTTDVTQTTSLGDTSTTNVQTTSTQPSTSMGTTNATTEPQPPTTLAPAGTTLATPAASTEQPIRVEVMIKGGDRVSGTVEVSARAATPVAGVEFVILHKESTSVESLHLGQAHFDAATNLWVYNWDSTNTPDGTYRLFANVTALNGTMVRSVNVRGVLVKNEKETPATTATTMTPAEEYLKRLQEQNQQRLDERKREFAQALKVEAEKKGVTQSATEERVLQKTGVASISSRPSRLTQAVDFEKVMNEKSQEIKDAVEKGDTTKRAEIVREIVRTAQGAPAGTAAQNDPELTRKVEEGVAKLEQVITDQTHGIVDEKTFKVERVEVAETVTKPDGTQTASKIAFKGKGLPDSFVTLYIFSIPTVVTVKTDSEGNWNYTLDKELDNGNHQVYVGITDVKGKVVVKSNPLPFVKTASAITVEEALAVPQAQAAPSLVESSYLYGVVTIIILVVAAVLIFMGIRLSRRTPESDTPNQNQ